MNTIIGTSVDTQQNPKGMAISFVSASTGLVSGAQVTVHTTKKINSKPSDGTFSIQLEPGYYIVTFASAPEPTQFTIAVPTGSATLNFGDIVVNPVSLPPGTAPASLWNNGVLSGSNLRFTYGVGLEIYDFDDGLWHTLICTGSPAQIGISSGHA